MDIRESLLLLLSRPPESSDYTSVENTRNIDDPLKLLSHAYPDFPDIVSGKHVADFGCGPGYQSVALFKRYECSVVGIDSNPMTLEKATELSKSLGIAAENVSFVEKIPEDMEEKFDVVISQNSFEHFPDPIAILGSMRRLIKNSGVILITFGPPWLAPYGSHMHFFCKVPWVNVLFPEKIVMRVRNRFRNDGATRYEDVESGLNKMTVSRFENIVESSNLSILYRKYECVKQMNFFAKLPLLREFFINHVSVVLKKP